MIDWDRLSALRTDMGDDDFAAVAMLFVTEIEETLVRLSAAPDHIGPDDFHFLRGSAANLGFRGLARACQAAETTITAGASPNISEIVALFHRSVAEVRPKLPGKATTS